MTPAPAALRLRLALLYAAVSTVWGVTLPFWPAWLAGHGMTAAEIGILVSLPAWIRMTGSTPIANLADRRGEVRRPIVILVLIAFGGYGLFEIVGGFWAYFLASLVAGLGLTSVMPLVDSYTLCLAASRGLHYGRIRLWGSVGFIATGMGTGWVLSGRSIDVVLLLTLAALGFVLVVALMLPVELPTADRGSARDWRSLLTDRGILLLLVAAGLIQASHAMLYGFATLHWLAAGHDEAVIGLLWGFGTACEIVIFAAGNFFVRRFGASGLLLASGVAAVLRWTLAGVTTALPALIVIQALHGLSYGAGHLGAMAYLTRRVPPGLSATAQGLYSGLAVGAAFGTTMLAAGGLYHGLGGGAFLVMAAMSIVGTIVALMLARERRH